MFSWVPLVPWLRIEAKLVVSAQQPREKSIAEHFINIGYKNTRWPEWGLNQANCVPACHTNITHCGTKATWAVLGAQQAE